MHLQYIPLLRQQRDFYRRPRDYERFKTYLRDMIGSDGRTIKNPPLVGINPMAREHVLALLDEYLALNADEVAAQAMADAAAELTHIPGDFKLSLIIADDLKGGWTNRYACEYGQRFPEPRAEPCKWWPRAPWLTGILWSSEPASLQTVREEIRMTLYRVAYIHEHGVARTLREKMAQEGRVMAMAGCTQPLLDEDDVEYSREGIGPFLDAEDMRTAIECLYGDAAGRTLGFTPRGLSRRAGLAVGLWKARQDAQLTMSLGGRDIRWCRPPFLDRSLSWGASVLERKA